MQTNADEAGRRNLRDFLQMYNKFTEECFTRCVQNLNYRVLTPDELACTERCASKLVNINHRLISVYMEINPLNKQLAQLEAQSKEQQQVQGADTSNQADGTQSNLANQVKGVFGEETQITDASKTVVDVNKDVASNSTSIESSNKLTSADSTVAQEKS